MGNRTYRRWAKQPDQSLMGFVAGGELDQVEQEAQRLAYKRLRRQQRTQAGLPGVRKGQWLRHFEGEVFRVEGVQMSEQQVAVGDEPAAWRWVLTVRCAGAVLAPHMTWPADYEIISGGVFAGEAEYALQGKWLRLASKPERKDLIQWYFDHKGVVIPPKAIARRKLKAEKKAQGVKRVKKARSPGATDHGQVIPTSSAATTELTPPVQPVVPDFVTTFPPLLPRVDTETLEVAVQIHARLEPILLALGQQIAALQLQAGWKKNKEVLLVRNTLASEARDVLAEYTAYFGAEATVAFRKFIEAKARSL